MSCGGFRCCYYCLKCCKKDKKKENYAHIEYSDFGEPDLSSNRCKSHVPLKTIFQMPQYGKRFITQPHSIKTPANLQEVHLLSTSEESVVKEQPKAVTYGSTKGDESQLVAQRRMTIDYSDVFAQPATFTECANNEKRHLPLRLRSEELSSQSKVPQLPVRSQSLGPEVLSSQFVQVPQLPVLVEEGDGQSYPSLQFSLHYDIQRRTMTIHLQEASNLPAKDRSGTSDPFVVMHLHPNKEEIFESKIVYKTLNPFFDQSFEFHNLQLDDVHRQSLVFRIYDHDRFSKNDMIGGIVLPLKDVDVYGVVYRMRVDERVEKFRSKEYKGDIHIALAYKPEQDVLNGMILKVTNLEKQDVSGLADPYVKVYLVYQGKRVSKWKSSVKKNSLVATFNESFQFKIEKKDINDVGLEIVVMDYDRLSRDDFIGTVLLGVNAGHHSGFSHWADMVAAPHQRISRWHSIKSTIHQTRHQKTSKTATL